MDAITRSRNAMMAATAAAALYALGSVFALVAYATLSDSADGANTYRDWGHAADWMHFLGAFGALVAVGVAGWEALPSNQRDQLGELALAAVSTLLIAIGALILAASSSSQSAGNVLGAVGLGGWALLALARAARYNLAEKQTPGSVPPVVPLWLMAAGGLLLIAIGSGFTIQLGDRGSAIASAVLEAIGAAILVIALIGSRARGLLRSRPVASVILGLVVLGSGFVAVAIVAGLVFTP
ncbi:MAG TPA: hypothetical protein VNL71_14970, partial [Chloroflexota bacterium]|nr:hypothetical protein [Chloroflexota bacterium]